jgi:segregation and condensation protein B
MTTKKKKKEKEEQEALKRLRTEVAGEIADQLPPELLDPKREKQPEPSGSLKVQSEDEVKRIIEAILFTASKPVTSADFKRALPGFNGSKIEKCVRELQAEYEQTGRSFRIQDIAGGFECATHPKYAPWIVKLELQRKAKQATQSALETLAILAYKQPMTRVEIEDLRGVDASGVLATLLDRQLIRIVGKKDILGRPFLYGTTDKFLQHFGLKALTDLPNISEIQTLVENSVKRDELLRTERMVEAGDGPDATLKDVTLSALPVDRQEAKNPEQENPSSALPPQDDGDDK